MKTSDNNKSNTIDKECYIVQGSENIIIDGVNLVRNKEIGFTLGPRTK